MEDGDGPAGREVRLGSLSVCNDGRAAAKGEQCGGGGAYVLRATPQGRVYVRTRSSIYDHGWCVSSCGVG